MKSLLLTVCLALFGLSLNAQSGIDQRLSAKFTKEALKEMDIETLRFHTHCIENAFVIMDLPVEKSNDHAFSGAKNIQDLSEINFFDLNVELKEDEYQYFRLLGTDKMLTVKPISLIKTELK